MKRLVPIAAACAATLLLLASHAHAAEGENADKPMALWSSVGLDSAWWSAGGVGSTFAFVPFVSYEIQHSGLVFDASLPFVAVDSTAFDEALGGMGNPGLGAHGAILVAPRMWLTLGMSLHLPLSSVHDNAYRGANLSAALAYSANNAYDWLYDYFPLTFPIGLEWNPAKPVWIRLLVEPQMYIPLGRPTGLALTGSGHFEYAQLQRIELEGRSDMGIGGGLDMNYMLFATNGNGVTNNDHMQMSLEPFFSYTNDVFFMRFGFLAALDNPLGFAFDKGTTVFTAHLTVGARLD